MKVLFCLITILAGLASHNMAFAESQPRIPGEIVLQNNTGKTITAVYLWLDEKSYSSSNEARISRNLNVVDKGNCRIALPPGMQGREKLYAAITLEGEENQLYGTEVPMDVRRDSGTPVFSISTKTGGFPGTELAAVIPLIFSKTKNPKLIILAVVVSGGILIADKIIGHPRTLIMDRVN
jgi:hypothetical protein